MNDHTSTCETSSHQRHTPDPLFPTGNTALQWRVLAEKATGLSAPLGLLCERTAPGRMERHHMQGSPPCQGQSAPVFVRRVVALSTYQMLSAPCVTTATSQMLLTSNTKVQELMTILAGVSCNMTED